MSTRFRGLKITALCVCGVLMISNTFVWLMVFDEEVTEGVEVSFLDVGQGDAAFIESPSGKQVLVDGGEGREVLFRLSDQMGFLDKSLNALVMTHTDRDHGGGLSFVFKRFDVGVLLSSVYAKDNETYLSLHEAVVKEGIKNISARAGYTIRLGDGAVLYVLYPFSVNQDFESANDSSVVLKLVYKDTSALLTGDISKETEKRLMEIYGSQEDSFLKSDILKVAHHGSQTSTSAQFLSAVSPTVAIISAGKDNQYGHPSEEVTTRLKEASVTTLCTCEEGTLTFYLTEDGFARKKK